jgi:hypothetical protein
MAARRSSVTRRQVSTRRWSLRGGGERRSARRRRRGTRAALPLPRRGAHLPSCCYPDCLPCLCFRLRLRRKRVRLPGPPPPAPLSKARRVCVRFALRRDDAGSRRSEAGQSSRWPSRTRCENSCFCVKSLVRKRLSSGSKTRSGQPQGRKLTARWWRSVFVRCRRATTRSRCSHSTTRAPSSSS